MIVLDASAAVEIVRGTEKGESLRCLVNAGEFVHSVELYKAEVSSAFWKYAHVGMCSKEEAILHVAGAIELVDEFHPIDELYVEALSEAIRLDHSPHDLLYLVLARRMGATLFTCDRRLVRLCEQNGVNCVCELATEDRTWTVRADMEK